MFTEEREGLNELVELAADISNWHSPLPDAISDRLYFIEQVLKSDILLLHKHHDKIGANDLLTEIKNKIAEIKKTMIDELIPLFEIFDDAQRIKAACETIKILGNIEAFNIAIDDYKLG
jgi:predicted RNA-binding protein